MKIAGVLAGTKVKGDVQTFTTEFFCKKEGVEDKLAAWVAEHVSNGWTPVSHFYITKRPNYDIFDVFYLSLFVGKAKAKEIPVRFFSLGGVKRA